MQASVSLSIYLKEKVLIRLIKKKFIRFKNLRKMEDWNLSISFLKSNENEFEFYYLQISDE